jgi:hypothetical protein
MVKTIFHRSYYPLRDPTPLVLPLGIIHSTSERPYPTVYMESSKLHHVDHPFDLYIRLVDM